MVWIQFLTKVWIKRLKDYLIKWTESICLFENYFNLNFKSSNHMLFKRKWLDEIYKAIFNKCIKLIENCSAWAVHALLHAFVHANVHASQL